MNRLKIFICVIIIFIIINFIQALLLNSVNKEWKSISTKCNMSDFIALNFESGNLNVFGGINNKSKNQTGVLLLFTGKKVVILNITGMEICVYTQL